MAALTSERPKIPHDEAMARIEALVENKRRAGYAGLPMALEPELEKRVSEHARRGACSRPNSCAR
jgi:hypothetical protein